MNNYIFVALSSFLSVLILSGCSIFGIRKGYEHMDYSVVDRLGDVEIRQYGERVAAEVRRASSSNDAFRTLFRYISGENVQGSKVDMTTPVEISRGEKIAMTTPVEASSPEGGDVTMRFFLPTSYTSDTAPKPRDGAVSIVALPPEIVAVLRYSGSSNDARFKEEREKLLEVLRNSKWSTVGTPTFLGYDPPFTLPFLKRNEVKVSVRENLQRGE